MSTPRFRNHNQRQLIDKRHMIVGRLLEDNSSFTLTRMIKQGNIESETLLIVDAPIVKTASERTKTRLPRLVNRIGVKPGEFRDLPVVNDETGLTIRFENLGRKRFRIHLNGYLKRMNAGLHDQVIIRFVVLLNRVTGVTLDYIDAFDKGMDAEIEQFFAMEAQSSETDWVKLEYFLDRLLRTSQLLAEQSDEYAYTQIDFFKQGVKERCFITWEWLGPKTLLAHCIGPEAAYPRMEMSEINELVALGWSSPKSNNERPFSHTFSNSTSREIAKFFIRTLKCGYSVRPSNSIFIEPFELLEFISKKTMLKSPVENYQTNGIKVVEEVQIPENWIYPHS